MNRPTYILHYAPDNASLVIRLALEEIGADYRTHLVDRHQTQQRSAAYLALNPNGLIPVLETDQGPLFETAAVLLWLADRHGGLAPAPADMGRGDFLKWLFFLSNTLHPALRMLFYPVNCIGTDPAHLAQLARATRTQVTRHLGILDTRWQEPRALGLDLYLCALLRWLALYPVSDDKSWFDLRDYPALLKTTKALESRASVGAAQEAEGLGVTPFSAPQLPSPPEGSAT
ncbi:glutathione S-transferase family protein [Roseobacter weihaiensis]|uniref:glutathione S-transferase family protein n=1 Tax=Roseobacter weihaiensis TaxID=2763262 RepID=UPI001D0B711C|nr:glutathione S-transferase family protein [Roseobacter sp. H9]